MMLRSWLLSIPTLTVRLCGAVGRATHLSVRVSTTRCAYAGWRAGCATHTVPRRLFVRITSVFGRHAAACMIASLIRSEFTPASCQLRPGPGVLRAHILS
eukprot:356995-Chlamydomonas_euryale.AAC.21